MEADYRNENELLIRCSVGCDHFLSFSYYIEDEQPSCYKEFSISFIPFRYSLWHRVKAALKYVFRNKQLYYESINLTVDDCRQIATLMGKYIDEVIAIKEKEDVS